MKKLLIAGLIACTSSFFAKITIAQEVSLSGHHNHTELKATDHAPLGVMGNHMHKKGEWMLSYRFMRMHMEDNRDGTDSLSPEEIATSFDNRFFGVTGQPPTLRVVPTEMTTNMHMIGAMYAPTDWLTLMAMGHYIDREMDHITFQGGTGTTQLGEFTTKTSGWGDTRLSGLFHLYEDSKHTLHFNAGVSLPTGSITEEDDVLTPMNMRPRLRLPYAMQLGSGTFDLMPGITYNGRQKNWHWGAQYNATFRLGENDEDYSLGDKHILTAWGAYNWLPSVSTSLRMTTETESDIDGIDDEIIA
ncbi:MAG: transporter, partial [Pseudomonadota bacterium]